MKGLDLLPFTLFGVYLRAVYWEYFTARGEIETDVNIASINLPNASAEKRSSSISSDAASTAEKLRLRIIIELHALARSEDPCRQSLHLNRISANQPSSLNYTCVCFNQVMALVPPMLGDLTTARFVVSRAGLSVGFVTSAISFWIAHSRMVIACSRALCLRGSQGSIIGEYLRAGSALCGDLIAEHCLE